MFADMYKLVVSVLVLCSLLGTSYTVEDDTLIDDEDSVSTTQIGVFVLELSSTFGCDDWLNNDGETRMRNDILTALVQAVFTGCQCDFTVEHVEQVTTLCSENARNILSMSGKIRITDSPQGRNMSTLLRGVEQWAESRPTFSFPLELSFDMNVRVTVTGASTRVGDDQDASGSGSGDYITTDPVTTTPTTNTASMKTTDIESETTSMEPMTTAVMSSNTTDHDFMLNSFEPLKMSLITTAILVLSSFFCSVF